MSDQEYKSKIEQWHQRRVDSLTQKDNWLSLAGLYWLKKGVNSFGSDSSNDIIFPNNEAPGKMGQITLQDSIVRIKIDPEIRVKSNEGRVQNIQMITDAGGKPTLLHYESLQWYIIKRGERYAVRLKDARNPTLAEFDSVDRFEATKKWRVRATFTPYDSMRTMDIPTITGQPSQMNIPGILSFIIEGREYTLIPTEGNEEHFFVIFGDKTNGNTTYGGGRFVYVDKPEGDNATYIDFNKAYNPPCVFTAYATCPLPPSENKLRTAIKAGEKMYGETH